MALLGRDPKNDKKVAKIGTKKRNVTKTVLFGLSLIFA